jgi:uncharacterized protein YegL
MKNDALSAFAALIFMLFGCRFAIAGDVPRDIVLMIDNSGSMNKGDPQFMTRNALVEFVEKLSAEIGSTQVAVLIFDHRINLSVPLTTVSEATKNEIMLSADNIDYRGKLTDIPAAMERAIYELKTRGQAGSQKSIIFITDGIVDTGDKSRDVDRTRWLREDLSEEAVKQGIKIFGIAFTDSADFELIQSLAYKTKSQYFRAYLPEEISEVFSQIHQHIMSSKPAPTGPVSPPLALPPQTSAELPKPEIDKSPIYVTEAPEPTPPPAKAKRKPLPNLALVFLALIILATVFVLMKLRRKASIPSPVPAEVLEKADEHLPEASLRNVNDLTNQGDLHISKTVTKIGRIGRINHHVIDHETISREHAVIEYKNFSFWIVDQGSSNGTFVNGKRIANQTRLNHGDTISFDIYAYEFVMPSMACDDTIVDRTVYRRSDQS